MCTLRSGSLRSGQSWSPKQIIETDNKMKQPNQKRTKIEHLQTKRRFYLQKGLHREPNKLPELAIDRTGRPQIRIAWRWRIDRLVHHRRLLLQSCRVLRGHRLRIVQYWRLHRRTRDRCQIEQRHMKALLLAAGLRPSAMRPFVAEQRVVASMQRHEVLLVFVRLVEVTLRGGGGLIFRSRFERQKLVLLFVVQKVVF